MANTSETRAHVVTSASESSGNRDNDLIHELVETLKAIAECGSSIGRPGNSTCVLSIAHKAYLNPGDVLDTRFILSHRAEDTLSTRHPLQYPLRPLGVELSPELLPEFQSESLLRERQGGLGLQGHSCSHLLAISLPTDVQYVRCNQFPAILQQFSLTAVSYLYPVLLYSKSERIPMVRSGLATTHYTDESSEFTILCPVSARPGVSTPIFVAARSTTCSLEGPSVSS